MNGLRKMIQTYLEAPNTDYAIMINGKWGCGKSYYVDHELNDIITGTPIEKHQVVDKDEDVTLYSKAYISLYGITNVDEFHSHVFYGLYPMLKKKWVSLAGTAVSRVAKFFNADITADKMKNLELFLNRYVLVFDDLERISPQLSVVDVMGWINAYAEHEKCKVIIVCNENAIREQTEIRTDNRYAEYLKYKEKTVRFTYNYEADVEKVYDAVIGKKEEKEKAFYLANRSLILDLYNRGGEKNLRTLLFVLDCLYNVCSYTEGSESEIRLRVLITFMIYAMECKKGASKEQLEILVREELNWSKLQVEPENIAENIFDENGEQDNKGKTIVKPLNISKYAEYSGKMLRMLELVDYIITGDLDAEVLKQTIANQESEYKRQKETQQGILVKELKNYAYINDDEFIGKIDQLKTYITGNQYNMYEMLDIFTVLLKFHHYRIQGFEITDDLFDVFIDALDEASKSHAYDFRFELCAPIWDPQDKSYEGQLYNKLKSHAIYLNKKCYQKEGTDDAQNFIEVIKANDLQKVKEYRENDRYHGIIYNMDWEKLWALIISEQTKNPVACAAIDILEYWVVKYGSDPNVWLKLHDYVSEYVKEHPIETCTKNNIRAMFLFPLHSTLSERVR